MTTVNGGIQANSAGNRKWRTSLDYTVSNSETATTVSGLHLYVEQTTNASWTKVYFTNRSISLQGSSVWSKTDTLTVSWSSSGGRKSVISISNTSSKTRTCSDSTLAVSASIKHKDSGKTSTASVNVSVPARTKYTITFNNNGGTGGSPSLKCASCGGNHKSYGYNATIQGTNPSRTGYTFAGWWTAASGGSQVTTVTSNAAQTLYAHWTENTATLTYNASGISGATLPSNATMKYTTATTAGTATPPSGYTFVGWATSEANAKAGTVTYAAGDTVKAANVVPSATTLYAVWKSILSYNANGHGTAPSSSNMYYTPAATAEAAITTLGYTFTGWNTLSDGSGTSYAAGDTVKAASTYKSNTTLYAQWRTNNYVKVNGAWKEVAVVYVKVEGVWKPGTILPIPDN